MPTQRRKKSGGACQCVGGGVVGGREKEHTHVEGRERERARTHAHGAERESTLAPPLVCFSSTWACPMQIGLSHECCLFYLKSSLWSSDLPLTFLCSIFAGFPLPCLLATTILDSFSLVYLPNSKESAYQCREHGFNPWS